MTDPTPLTAPPPESAGPSRLARFTRSLRNYLKSVRRVEP